MDDREHDECCDEETERDCLSLLNGRATAWAVFLTDFLSDAALLEAKEDLLDKVSADCTILVPGGTSDWRTSRVQFIPCRHQSVIY